MITDTNACVLEAIQKWRCNLETETLKRLDDMIVADIMQIFVESNDAFTTANTSQQKN